MQVHQTTTFVSINGSSELNYGEREKKHGNLIRGKGRSKAGSTKQKKCDRTDAKQRYIVNCRIKAENSTKKKKKGCK